MEGGDRWQGAQMKVTTIVQVRQREVGRETEGRGWV